MRILTEPKVYLVARPAIAEEGVAAFLEENGLKWPTPTDGVKGAEQLTELAGRCCYMSFGNKAGSKTNQGYINNLLGRDAEGNFRPGPAHGSVIEHSQWSFLIVGAGRGFSHEQVRHRVGVAYSQLSTRYCDFEREEEEGTWDPGFCIPPLGQLSEKSKELYQQKFKSDQEWYKKILDSVMSDLQSNEEFQEQLKGKPEREAARMLRKAARGAARDVLPIGTEAIMTMSCNARSIWNMAYMRASVHAEGVIRDVYVQIVKLMEVEMPALFNKMVYQKVWDGSVAVELPRDKL